MKNIESKPHMRYTILFLCLFFSVSLAQENKPNSNIVPTKNDTPELMVRLSKPKIFDRIRDLRSEYGELQRLVEDPTLAVPAWKARMRQIEGIITGLQLVMNDSTLFLVDSTALTKPRRREALKE